MAAIVCGSEGDAGYSARVRSERTELGLDDRVTITGFVPDRMRDDIVAAADVVVHLAKRESFGLAVVEGMAAGKAVVAAAASGPSSLIEDGRSGVLVPVDDDAAAAAAVDRLLSDPAERAALGAGAAEAARSHPVEGMVRAVEAVLGRGARPVGPAPALTAGPAIGVRPAGRTPRARPTRRSTSSRRRPANR